MKPIPVSEFSSHVERLHADRDKLFEMEYEVSESKIMRRNILDAISFMTLYAFS